MNRIIQGIGWLAVHKRKGTINGKSISIFLKLVINVIMAGNVLVIVVNKEKSTLLSEFLGSGKFWQLTKCYVFHETIVSNFVKDFSFLYWLE